MIVIAGAIIISLTQTNIIDQAESAKDKYNLSQVKESVELERYNALLSRYDTAENVNISVKELLGLTDTDAMNIISAVTMPENIQTGKYYRLDVTRYGLVDTGAIENNTIKGIYVINDNYDIYYVISGTIGEAKLEETEIDDEKVSEIMLEWIENYELSDEKFAELKKALQMEDSVGNNINEISISFTDQNYEAALLYFYEIDRLYKVNGYIDDENEMAVTYLSKNENKESYEYVEKVKQIWNELKNAFVGKTEEEIKNIEDLDAYILNKCKTIKTIVTCRYGWDAEFLINDLTFEFGGPEFDDEDFCDWSSFYFILDETGTYIDVYLEMGA